MTRVPAIALCLSLSLSAFALQKPPAHKSPASTPDKLIAVTATGTRRYTDKEILAASGLQLGQSAADGDFKEAARRLGDSGLFTDVVYSYASSSAGVKLDLQLTDIDDSKLVPAHFENFVWFTDAKLLSAVQHSVPLFKQFVPIAGTLTDHVAQSLQAILSEHHLPGRVDYLREALDQSGGPLVSIAYRVEEINIYIHGFEFPGASPEQSALLANAARRAVGGSYARYGIAQVAKFDLLPIYLQRGFLKASFGLSGARVVPPSSTGEQPPDPSDIQVDVLLPVAPGKIYAASAVDWKGNSALATGEVKPLIHLTSGHAVDGVQLGHDLENVARLYRSRGYMLAQIKPDADFDDEKATVHYTLTVAEGDLYKMGELEINGLDTQAKARMVEAWTLAEAQPYNADYPAKFLKDTNRLLPKDVQWSVTVHETLDKKDKTVDVEIRFKQQ